MNGTKQWITNGGEAEIYTVIAMAPLFIKTGEKVKVDTRTGKYMERA